MYRGPGTPHIPQIALQAAPKHRVRSSPQKQQQPSRRNQPQESVLLHCEDRRAPRNPSCFSEKTDGACSLECYANVVPLETSGLRGRSQANRCAGERGLRLSSASRLGSLPWAGQQSLRLSVSAESNGARRPEQDPMTSGVHGRVGAVVRVVCAPQSPLSSSDCPSLRLPWAVKRRWLEAWPLVFFLTSTSHQVQAAREEYGATNGYGRFATWVRTGTSPLLWGSCGCLRWEVGGPQKQATAES